MPDLLAVSWTYAGDVIPGSGARSPWSLGERIEAVAGAGFAGIDLDLADLRYYPLAEIKRMLDANGLTCIRLGLMAGWWHGPTEDDLYLMRAAAELGAFQIVAGAPEAGGAPLESLRTAWWLVSERAKVAGARLALESSPFSGLRTVEDAARFVQAVAHPNGGLLVDFWHAHRGGSSRESLLSTIDPAYLAGVELCDGLDPAPTDLFAAATDAIDNRRLPGDGRWDVTEFIRTMESLGFEGPWGVEVTAIDFRRLSLAEAVGRASIATQAALQRAS